MLLQAMAVAATDVVVPFFLSVPTVSAKIRQQFTRNCDSADVEFVEAKMANLKRQQGWDTFPGFDGHYVSDRIVGMCFCSFNGSWTGPLTPMNKERRAM